MLGKPSVQVVSAERFMQEKRAMCDRSSCSQCQRQRTVSQSMRRKHRSKKQHPPAKCGSPVVVRLRDSLKYGRKGSLSASDLDDWDVSSTDDGPSGPARSSPIGKPKGKNFSAFLSAVAKVHSKDGSGVEENLAKQKDSDKNQFVSAPLNNSLRDVPCKKSQSELSLHGPLNNVQVICNDLNTAPQRDTSPSSASSSADTSSSDSDVAPSATSSSSSGVDSDDDEQVMSADELQRLVRYSSGCPLTRYDHPPQQCPKCLQAYPCHSRTYPGHHCPKTTRPLPHIVRTLKPTGNHISSVLSPTTADHITVSGPGTTDHITVSGPTTADHIKGPTKTDHITVTGPGTVDISLARYYKTMPRPVNELEHCVSGGVVVDLTHSDVVYNVETHDSWLHAPHWHYYHPVTAMLGCPVQASSTPPAAYYFTPAGYYVTGSPVLPGRTHPGHCRHGPPYYLPVHATDPLLDHRHLTATQPPQRPWLPIAHPENSRPIAIYTVMCYNVLCDKYATRQLYGYCPPWALNWDYRKKAIIDEIRQYSADIISLQEVETEQFDNFFLPELKMDGYDGIFSPKSRARTMIESERKYVDGCAIFFRTSKFSLIKKHLIEFNQLAISTAEGSHDMINRVMTKDNIGLAALLETKEAIWENGLPPESQIHQPILIATCHVHWDPEFSDVKLIQTMMLMNELKNIIEETQRSLRPGSTAPDSNSIPLLLCGDLNSLPDSGVVEYLKVGRVEANHKDFKDLGYEECLRKLSKDSNKDIFAHGFKLSQAYTKDVMPYTNYTFDFKGMIDYVFYSRDFMRPLGLLGPLDQEWLRENKVFGCPHPQIPSDHLPLLVELEMGQFSPSSSQSREASGGSRASGSGAAAGGGATTRGGANSSVGGAGGSGGVAARR